MSLPVICRFREVPPIAVVRPTGRVDLESGGRPQEGLPGRVVDRRGFIVQDLTVGVDDDGDVVCPSGQVVAAVEFRCDRGVGVSVVDTREGRV